MTEILDTLEAEIQISDVEGFHYYFTTFDLKVWIEDVSQRKERWKENGPLVVCLQKTKAATAEIHETAQKVHKVDKDTVGDDFESTPLDTDINDSLQDNWMAKYGLKLHESSELPSQFLHSMYKKLKNRRGEAEHVKGVYTKTQKAPPGLSSGRKSNRQKIAPNIDLLVGTRDSEVALGDEPNYHIDRSPHIFFVALENMLRIFCLAGCFKVPDPQTSDNKLVFMVDRKPVEAHIYDIRGFIMDWTTRSNRPSDALILESLRRVDMNIRKRWWDLFKENEPKGRTFTSCVLQTKFFAEQQWCQNFARDLLPSPSTPPPRASGWDNNHDSPFKDWKAKGKGKAKTLWDKGGKGKGGKDKGGKGGKGKDAGQTGGFKETTTWIGNKKVKAARNKGGVLFCHFYNQQTCREGEQNCKHLHRCNVLIQGNKICGGTHPASEHRGSTVLAE